MVLRIVVFGRVFSNLMSEILIISGLACFSSVWNWVDFREDLVGSFLETPVDLLEKSLLSFEYLCCKELGGLLLFEMLFGGFFIGVFIILGFRWLRLGLCFFDGIFSLRFLKAGLSSRKYLRID